jgi:hypothetical protein
MFPTLEAPGPACGDGAFLFSEMPFSLAFRLPAPMRGTIPAECCWDGQWCDSSLNRQSLARPPHIQCRRSFLAGPRRFPAGLHPVAICLYDPDGSDGPGRGR